MPVPVSTSLMAQTLRTIASGTIIPKKYSILGIALPLIPRYLCYTSCSSPHKLLFFNLLLIFLYLYPQLLWLCGNCGNITLNKHISVSETLTISTFPMKVDERPGHFPGLLLSAPAHFF